ncbi:MAG TPA: hypothetical protein ENK85_03220 [Saprospiraceae bacterium]|nr:hypothetical protein [Saprospiraceae bacterium]
MNTTHFLLLLLTIGMLSSCTRKAAVTKSKNATTEEIKQQKSTPEYAPDGTLHGLVMIALDRMPCHGTCPWDRVVFYEDGAVYYTGHKYVDKIGDFKAKTPLETTQNLATQAKKIGFFQMENQYPVDPAQKVADFPMTRISIRKGNLNKTITIQNDFPQELANLVKDIVAATEKLHFQKINKAPESVEAPNNDHGTLILTIKRTPCYGSCPWYEASFYDNGTILYKGEKYVDHIGSFTLQTKPEIVRALTNKAQKIGFFKMEANYPVNPAHKVTDLPTTTIMVKNGRTGKTITMQNEIPPVLIEYTKEIEGTLMRLDYPEKK